jgi:hypothetical protein
MSTVRLCALAAVLLFTVSCRQSVDLKQALQVTDLSTGLFDAGVVDGQNKLVPSVTFRLRDTSGKVSSVPLNTIFKFADNGEIHEEIFKQRVDFKDGQTDLLIVRPQHGYTGEAPQSRAEMLKNSAFRDMEAVIMVREVAAQWVELHRVRVERQLLTQ